MNWEKRLEDARARRQVVLEQKDRAARAAKAATRRIPEPAETPSKSGSVQEIPRARPVGANARVLEAAMRQRETVQLADVLQADEPAPRANENEAPDINDIREYRAEDDPQSTENVGLAFADPPTQRRSRPGLRTLLAGLVVLVSFGIGIIAGPSIVSKFQSQATLSPSNIAPTDAPRQPKALAVSEERAPALTVAGDAKLLTLLSHDTPLPPELIAFQPALPTISPSEVGLFECETVSSDTSQATAPINIELGSSVQIAAVRPVPRTVDQAILVRRDVALISLAAVSGPKAPLLIRRPVDEVLNVEIASLPVKQFGSVGSDKFALSAVMIDALPVALLSPGPQLESEPGLQTLAFLRDEGELPTMPLYSNAPNPPTIVPGALPTHTEDKGVSANVAAPPLHKKLPHRLTGIGDLRSYLVFVQSRSAPGDGQLADIESAIVDTGLPIGKINRVGYKISTSHIRYYHRRDAAGATALAERIGVRVRDFTNYRPSPAIGTLEVFLSGTGAANSQRLATQSETQTIGQDRELIELRNRIIQSLQRGDHL
ncbi:MAG: hypothetical protein ACR2O1_00465 [Boseongicola sp.]